MTSRRADLRRDRPIRRFRDTPEKRAAPDPGAYYDVADLDLLSPRDYSNYSDYGRF
jgi:hypothetical protein